MARAKISLISDMGMEVVDPSVEREKAIERVRRGKVRGTICQHHACLNGSMFTFRHTRVKGSAVKLCLDHAQGRMTTSDIASLPYSISRFAFPLRPPKKKARR